MTTPQPEIKDNAALNDLKMAHDAWLKSPMTRVMLDILTSKVMEINQSITQSASKAGIEADAQLRVSACRLQAYTDVHQMFHSFLLVAKAKGFPVIVQQPTPK